MVLVPLMVMALIGINCDEADVVGANIMEGLNNMKIYLNTFFVA